MIKVKASPFHALVRNHLQNERLERIVQVTQAIFMFPNFTKTQVFHTRARVRGFDSKLFHFSITQGELVDTLKFINPGEAWNILYADSFDKEDEPIWSLALYSRTSKGPSVGELLAVLNNQNITSF